MTSDPIDGVANVGGGEPRERNNASVPPTNLFPPNPPNK